MAERHPPRRTDADIEELLRGTSIADGELEEPPAEVWRNIAGAARLPDAIPDVPQLAERRRRFGSPKVVALAAAAVLVVAAIGTAALRSGDGSVPTVVASAQLAHDVEVFDPLGAASAANVSLVEEEGRLRLVVEGAGLDVAGDEPADLELWLIQPDADGNPVALVSLGLIDDVEQPGVFDIPATHDPALFSVVDISIEPRDGDRGHSGRSILRGQLADA